MIKDTVQGAIKKEHVKKYRNHFLEEPTFRLAMNAVTRGNLQDIALNRDVINANNWMFSHEVEESPDISNQKRAGTCWLFAELNWMRSITMKKFKIEKLEFSENYLMFYDKLEKANYYLEKLMTMLDKDIDDRHVRFVIDSPTPDGGEWHMIVNLINKYGLVPLEVMPGTWNQGNSRFINEILGYKIREGFAHMRDMKKTKKSVNAIREYKTGLMSEIYRIIATCMGIPPKSFNWSFRDKDKKYHQELNITPKDYFKKYVGLNLDECYSLASCPAHNTEFNKTYSIELFGNMVGGEEWKWLNLPVKELKKIALKILKKGEAVLYGCDVTQESNTKEGFMDTNVYDYDLIFQTPFNMDKKTRLTYGQSRLTHSMLLTGVEIVNNKPVRWKVENSWGEKVGKKGYFVMTDEWFDEHVLDLIVPGKYMPEKLLKLYKQKPEILPPWHVMA